MQLRCALRLSIECITNEGVPHMRKARANDVPPPWTEDLHFDEVSTHGILHMALPPASAAILGCPRGAHGDFA